jgi:sterol desaturase/sphingolipid hydroxylase (fatty acid hydroxylase superfamily)
MMSQPVNCAGCCFPQTSAGNALMTPMDGHSAMRFLVEFLALFSFILILGYVVPAGAYYWLYHVRKSAKKEHLRIQNRRPTREGIVREVRLSVVSIFIFSVMGVALFEFYKAGWTSIYWKFREYGWWYFPISIFLCMVLHDTYFYWTHRFMHWRPVFKYLHVGHHRSISPTPWAIFAFQPGEAIIQFLGIMALVMFLPLHPLALLIFLWMDTQMNTAGHTGYEVVPRFISSHPLYQGFNTVTHHDAHHTNMGRNFGSFFNVWDRWMGTFQDGATPKEEAAERETEPPTCSLPAGGRRPDAARPQDIHSPAL